MGHATNHERGEFTDGRASKAIPGGGEAVERKGLTAKEKYCWMEDVLIRFRYHGLRRYEKGVIRRYAKKGYEMLQVTGVQADSGVQMDRAIAENGMLKIFGLPFPACAIFQAASSTARTFPLPSVLNSPKAFLTAFPGKPPEQPPQ